MDLIKQAVELARAAEAVHRRQGRAIPGSLPKAPTQRSADSPFNEVRLERRSS